jgi:hypothetical protein
MPAVPLISRLSPVRKVKQLFEERHAVPRFAEIRPGLPRRRMTKCSRRIDVRYAITVNMLDIGQIPRTMSGALRLVT